MYILNINPTQYSISLNGVKKTYLPKVFSEVRNAVLNFQTVGNWEGIKSILEGTYRVPAENGFEQDLEGNKYFPGDKFPISSAVWKYLEEGGETKGLLRLHQDLQLNPIPHIRENLINWLTSTDLVPTTDGLILGYKAVKYSSGFDKLFRTTVNLPTENTRLQELVDSLNNNFKIAQDEAINSEPVFTDIYSGTTKITLGEQVSIPREKCDSNPQNLCSSGLHLGTLGYARNFLGSDKGEILLCAVRAANIMAIPIYKDWEKLRTTAYLPLAIWKEGELFFSPNSEEVMNKLLETMEIQDFQEIVNKPQASALEVYSSEQYRIMVEKLNQYL